MQIRDDNGIKILERITTADIPDDGVFVVPDDIYVIAERCCAKQGHLKKIILGSNVSIVKAEAFIDCNSLEYVKFSAAIKKINTRAFSRCSTLKEVEFEESTIPLKIADKAFDGCISLKKFPLRKGLYSLGEYVFADTGINDIAMPDTVNTVGEGCFYNCIYLKSVKLSKRISSIPKNCFFKCLRLNEVCLGENVRFIYDDAFAHCFTLHSIKTLNTNPFNYISDNAFYECEITSIIIGDKECFIPETGELKEILTNS